MNLKSLEGLPTLPKLKEELRWLNLSDNNLVSMMSLQPLANLNQLRILVLDENPLTWTVKSYRRAVFKLLPQIEVVDNFERSGFRITYDVNREVACRLPSTGPGCLQLAREVKRNGMGPANLIEKIAMSIIDGDKPEKVYLSNNLLESGFDQLAGCKEIRWLMLDGNNISNINTLRPLRDIIALRIVNVARNPFTAQIKSYRRAVFKVLPEIGICDNFENPGDRIGDDTDEEYGSDYVYSEDPLEKKFGEEKWGWGPFDPYYSSDGSSPSISRFYECMDSDEDNDSYYDNPKRVKITFDDDGGGGTGPVIGSSRSSRSRPYMENVVVKCERLEIPFNDDNDRPARGSNRSQSHRSVVDNVVVKRE